MDASTQTDKSALKEQKHQKRLTIQEEPHYSGDIANFKDTNIIVHSCEYEVFGIVQNVSLRRYTLRRAQKIGVRGWCRNTKQNTVKGVIQAYPKIFETMRLWLQYTGSPTCRIDKCVFGAVQELNDFTYNDFSIRATE